MRKYCILVLILLMSGTVFAQSKMSAYSRAMLNACSRVTRASDDANSHFALKQSAGGKKFVEAFVRFADKAAIADMETMGVKVGVVAGDCLTALIPLDAVNELLQMESVREVEIPRRAHLHNDEARAVTSHNATLAGDATYPPFTGRGVIYGTVDCGIDFNHANFRNADGSTRFLSVYLPDNDTGEKYTGRYIDEAATSFVTSELPGSFFNSDEAVKALTTDAQNMSHGTHTIGTAVGSCSCEYSGFAPDADIIACGTSDLSAVNIINTIAYTFDRAESVGKPAVVNISLGYNTGAHDGSDIEARMIDRLVGPGRIVCVSAGNEGYRKIHIDSSLAGGKPLKTILFHGYLQTVEAYSDFWGKPQDNLRAHLEIVRSSGEIVWTDTRVCHKDNTEVNSENGIDGIFDGKIAMEYSETPGGKANICVLIEGMLLTEGSCFFSVVIEGSEGAEVTGWCEQTAPFATFGLDGYTNGDSEQSISTIACGERSISVGAMVSRGKYMNIDGLWQNTGYDIGQLAFFSSWGPTADGRPKPDIVGPGMMVLSSVSNYDERYVPVGSMTVKNTEMYGRSNYWGAMQGTSMSCPAVAGIIATWLQLNPTLTPEDVKEILESTADNDDFTRAEPKKWGYGKINSFAGIKHIYSTMGVDEAVAENSPLVLFPNPSDGHFTVLLATDAQVEVSVYSLQGKLLACERCAAIGGSVEFDLSGRLLPGTYIVRAATAEATCTGKLIMK